MCSSGGGLCVCVRVRVCDCVFVVDAVQVEGSGGILTINAPGDIFSV